MPNPNNNTEKFVNSKYNDIDQVKKPKTYDDNKSNLSPFFS